MWSFFRSGNIQGESDVYSLLLELHSAFTQTEHMSCSQLRMLSKLMVHAFIMLQWFSFSHSSKIVCIAYSDSLDTTGSSRRMALAFVKVQGITVITSRHSAKDAPLLLRLVGVRSGCA